MDRRWNTWRQLHSTPLAPQEPESSDHQALAALLTEGRESECWTLLTSIITTQIRSAESRFLDTLAPSYEVYLQAWARRQALIGVLALPQAHTQEDHHGREDRTNGISRE